MFIDILRYLINFFSMIFLDNYFLLNIFIIFKSWKFFKIVEICKNDWKKMTLSNIL